MKKYLPAILIAISLIPTVAIGETPKRLSPHEQLIILDSGIYSSNWSDSDQEVEQYIPPIIAF